MKIILDTDIGSNIDDSFALLYLLKKCPHDLLGVTIVSAQSRERAALAEKMIKCFSSSIPVISGAEKTRHGARIENPLFLEIDDSENKNNNRQKTASEMSCSDLYREMILRYPQEIHMLCIGPTSNIAAFIDLYPDLSEKIKSIRILAGKFSEKSSYHRRFETNAGNDASALKTVIDKALCEVYVVGVEISIAAGQYKENLQSISPLTCRDELEKQLQAFKKMKRPVYMHDPVLAASVFSDILSFEAGRIWVNAFNGETQFAADKKFPKRFIANSIDVPKFWGEFNSILAR